MVSSGGGGLKVGELLATLGLDTSSFKRALSDAKDSSNKATSEISEGASGASIGFRTLVSSITAATLASDVLQAAGRKLVSVITDSVKAASESQDAQVELEAVLKASGHAAGISADEILSNSTALQHLTGTSDEALTSVQSLFLTFRNIGGATFKEATALALDMSKVFGQDLNSSAIQLGKALNDPIEGVTALRRVGVQLSDEQEKQIKDFAKVNDVAGAQRIILDELQKEVGGVSEALGRTSSGTLARFREGIGDLSETLGGALLSAFDDNIKAMADWAESEEAKRFADDLAEKVGNVADALGNVLGALVDLKNFGPIKIILDTDGNGFLVGAAAAAAAGQWEIAAALVAAKGGSAAAGALLGPAPATSTTDLFGNPLTGAEVNQATISAADKAASVRRGIFFGGGEGEAATGAVPSAVVQPAGATFSGGASTTGSTKKAAVADTLSPELQDVISQVLAALPGAIVPSLDTTGLADFKAAEAQFAEVRKNTNLDLARTALTMADLDAKGEELSPEFKALSERSDALKDALHRIDLIQDIRLDPFKDAMQAVADAADAAAKSAKEAADAEIRLAAERNRAALQLFNQTIPNGTRFASPEVFSQFIDNINRVSGSTIGGGSSGSVVTQTYNVNVEDRSPAAIRNAVTMAGAELAGQLNTRGLF